MEFSIFRYLMTLELLSGSMVALALLPLARRLELRRPLLAGSGALLAGLLLVTVYPFVQRARAAPVPFAVDLGPIPPDSTVLLLDGEPMAYLAAFADPRVRFIATNDYFMTLGTENPIQPLGAGCYSRPQRSAVGVGLARRVERMERSDAGALPPRRE